MEPIAIATGRKRVRRWAVRLEGYEVSVTEPEPSLQEECESALRDQASAVPLVHRREWMHRVGGEEYVYLSVRERSSREWRAGFPILLGPTRALPGHLVARVTRFGYGPETGALAAALQALPRWLDAERRVVSLHVGFFVRDGARRGFLERRAEDAGFSRSPDPRAYEQTVQIDLGPDEEDLLYSFDSTARYNIRHPGKKGFPVRSFSDPGFAGRMAELVAETYARTGGRPPGEAWSRHLRFARDHPRLYRIVGTFHPERVEPDSLVAFACGRHNGDHCDYATGASTRKIDSSVSLTYAPVWDLIRWARETGAEWFDMGGITASEGDDPLAGISDFKRYFSEDRISVGTEWRIDASGWRGRVTRALRNGARAVRSAADALAG